MKVFTRRSTTTAVALGIVSLVACLCVISSTTATIGFVRADPSMGQGINHIDNVQDQASFLIGKEGLFNGSAVKEEEGGVGVGSAEINSGLAGSIVLQPTAAAAAAAPEQSVEDDGDLGREVVGANGEAATEKSAESKKGMLTTRPDTPSIGRNHKFKHHHHRGHLGGQHSKKKGVVHRHRIPGGCGDKKHRHGENKDRQHGHRHHEKHRHQGGGQGQDGKKPPRVKI